MRTTRLLTKNFVLGSLLIASNALAQGYPPPLPPTQQPAAQQPAPQPAPPAYPPAPAYPPPIQPAPVAPPGWVPPQYGTNAASPYHYPTAPMEMRFVEGRPIPEGYHLETRPRKGLVIAGSIVFGVPYFLSLSVAASSKFEGDHWLYVPLVGPFVDLGTRKEDCYTSGQGTFRTDTYCSNDSSERFFLMADGLMQVAGATMFIFGLALPQKLLVRDDAPYVGSSRSHFAWAVAPQAMGRSGYGLGLAGTF